MIKNFCKFATEINSYQCYNISTNDDKDCFFYRKSKKDSRCEHDVWSYDEASYLCKNKKAQLHFEMVIKK